MPRQNYVKISQEAQNSIDCNIYKENDADRQTIKNATYHDLKMAAQQCRCLTCAAVLGNIRDAIIYYSESYVSKDMGKQKNKWARENRRFFINQLRENMASRTLKHNFTQGV